MAERQTFKTEYSVVSDIGKIRTNHEDNFLTPEGQSIGINEINTDNPRIEFGGRIIIKYCDFAHCAVADGMGGHKAGEIASSLAVSGLKGFLPTSSALKKTVSEYTETVAKINSDINEYGQKNGECSNLGSTFSGVIVYCNKIVAVNVGDSRVYVYNDNNLKRLTKDHTEGQMLVDLGVLTDEDVDSLKTKNGLTRYLGMGDVSAGGLCFVSDALNIKDSDIYLICSDGLTGCVSDGQIAEILSGYGGKSLKDICNRLTEKAFDESLGRRAGHDNITIILLRFASVPDEGKERKSFFGKLFGKKR